jgi:hypothetical protein
VDKKHLVVRRYGGVKDEAHLVDEELHRGAWGRGQTCPLPGCGINHQLVVVILDLLVIVPKTEKAAAVILYLQPTLKFHINVRKIRGGDFAPRERPCEEL